MPNCKYFLVTEAERQHVRQREQLQQRRDASCHQVFFFLQGKAPKKSHAILIDTLGDMHNRVLPTKTVWPSLNVVIFPPVMRLVLDDPKQ